MGRMAPELPRERRTVYRMLEQAALTWGTAPALHQPLGGGECRTYSWLEYRQIVEEIASGLRSIGIGLGDIVGLASETRAEFYLADIGVMANGSVSAAVYTSLAPADQARMLKGCDPRALFIENPKMLQTLDAAGLSELRVPRILFVGEAEGAITLDRLRQLGQNAMIEDQLLLERIKSEVRPEHHAILYLTSGATGEPKMGLVTNNAIVANASVGPKSLPLDNSDVNLVFLPSAHITQRLVGELLMVRIGTQVYFSEGLSKLPGELRTVRPNFFVAPPRVWERMYASITTEIRKRPAAIRKLFYMGLGVGSEANRAREEGRAPSPWVRSTLKFFDALVFSKIRARLGGRLKMAGSGAAPLGKDLGEFYASIGLPLVEGYGLTEGGVVALNPLSRPKSGSIGVPLPGMELKVAEDGELLIRAESLFSGYYKDPESSAAVLRDGWLHTGDVAEVDSDGYFYITGRKKELIISSNGKKIFPARIEALFKLEPLVNQVLLIGDRLPYMTALITINVQAAESLASAPGGEIGQIVRSPAVQQEMKRIVKGVNRHLAPFEQIRKFKILDREFSIESGEITPTMELRRAKVLENCRSHISELYVGREDFG